MAVPAASLELDGVDITEYLFVRIDNTGDHMFDSVIAPREQRALVDKMGGHLRYSGMLVMPNGIKYATRREATTVHPDAYEKWYAAFMADKKLRDARIDDAGARLARAQTVFDLTVRLFKHP